MLFLITSVFFDVVADSTPLELVLLYFTFLLWDYFFPRPPSKKRRNERRKKKSENKPIERATQPSLYDRYPVIFYTVFFSLLTLFMYLLFGGFFTP